MKLSGIFIRIVCVIIFVTVAANSFANAVQEDELPILFAQQEWGLLGFDTAVVPTSGKEPRPIIIQEKKYDRGLGTHAPGRIVLDLFGDYETFEAKAGVQTGNPKGTVVFQVVLDGKKVFDSGIMTEKDSAKPVKISVKDGQQLELVVTDAGDGMTGDVANWADINLVVSANASPRSTFNLLDIAPFAKVLTWDPAKISYHPNRVAELNAEQIFHGTEVSKNADGTYIVPTAENGEKCIGLQWYENRNLRTLAIEFAQSSYVPDPNQSRIEWWIGESPWQGDWIKLTGDIEASGNKWIIPVKYADVKLARNKAAKRRSISGAVKIRCIFPASQKPVILNNIKAFSRSRTENIKLSLQCDSATGNGKITMYNGLIVEQGTGETSLQQNWDISKPIDLNLKYCVTKILPRCDRTILKFQLPEGNFGVAVEDVIENGGVYVPDYGLYVTLADNPMSLQEYKEKKISGRKTVLEKVREMPDQSFERAMEKVHRKVQDQGPMMVSLAGDNIKYIVDRDGMIKFSPNGGDRSKDRGKIFNIVPAFGSGKDLEFSRGLYGDWLPVPVQTYKEGNIVYEQRSFVAPTSKTRAAAISWLETMPLFVCEFTVENTSSNSASANMTFSIMAKDKVPAVLKRVDKGITAAAEGKVIAFGDTSFVHNLKVDSEDGKLTIQGQLPGNTKEKFVVYIPGWEGSSEELSRLKSSSALLDDTEKYWKDILAGSMDIDIPSKLLKNLIVASQVHCMIAARNEDAGERISPWIAADIYGPLESEAQSIIRGMSLMGQEEFARRSLDFFINRYNKDGLLTTGYTLWGIGWHLWTLGDYYMVHRNCDWLNSVAPKVEKACNWIVSEREKTKRMDAYGEKVPGYGLMPPGVFADWSRFAYLVRPQGEFCAGLVGMAESFDDIKYPGSDVLIEKADEFKKELASGYLWSQGRSPVIRLSNEAWIPYSPAIIGCFGPVGEIYPGEDGGRAWGKDVSSGAHHLVPLGLLNQKDSREINWIASYLEDEWFLKAGHGDYSLEEVQKDWFDLGGFYKIQPYYCRITELYAYNDDVKPFIRAYFNAIPTLLSRENLSLWEHFHNIGGWNKTHETGWFLAQTRLMFVMERNDDELWLAAFVTNHWMKDGMKVSIRNAQTRFGDVSYQIVSHVKDGFIEAQIDPPTRNNYKNIVLRLRHPEGKTVKSVTVNGKEFRDYNKDKEYITLPASKGRINVIAEYEK